MEFTQHLTSSYNDLQGYTGLVNVITDVAAPQRLKNFPITSRSLCLLETFVVNSSHTTMTSSISHYCLLASVFSGIFSSSQTINRSVVGVIRDLCVVLLKLDAVVAVLCSTSSLDMSWCDLCWCSAPCRLVSSSGIASRLHWPTPTAKSSTNNKMHKEW